MRKLQLTNTEVMLIETALKVAYNKNMKLLQDGSDILVGAIYKTVIKQADQYSHLENEIKEGRKDV